MTLPETALHPRLKSRKSGFKWLWFAQILTAYYFAYFLIILPILGIIETPKKRPPSIADSVHNDNAKPSVSGGEPIPGLANAEAQRDDA